MTNYLYELKKSNRIRQKSLLKNNQDELIACLNYLKMANITPLDYELLQQKLIDITFQKQEELSNLRTYLGKNKKHMLESLLFQTCHKKKFWDYIFYDCIDLIEYSLLFYLLFSTISGILGQTLVNSIDLCTLLFTPLVFYKIAKFTAIRKILFDNDLNRDPFCWKMVLFTIVCLIPLWIAFQLMEVYLKHHSPISIPTSIPYILLGIIIGVMLMLININYTNKLFLSRKSKETL